MLFADIFKQFAIYPILFAMCFTLLTFYFVRKFKMFILFSQILLLFFYACAALYVAFVLQYLISVTLWLILGAISWLWRTDVTHCARTSVGSEHAGAVLSYILANSRVAYAYFLIHNRVYPIICSFADCLNQSSGRQQRYRPNNFRHWGIQKWARTRLRGFPVRCTPQFWLQSSR